MYYEFMRKYEQIIIAKAVAKSETLKKEFFYIFEWECRKLSEQDKRKKYPCFQFNSSASLKSYINLEQWCPELYVQRIGSASDEALATHV